MKPRNATADRIAKGLKSAQEQLGSTIEHTLSGYANDLIWEEECEFILLEKPELVERLRPTMLLKLQIEGYQGLIPDSTLEELTCNAYILVGDHLFYVEKARNKITEIPITQEQLQALTQLHTQSETFLQDITKITGHKPRRETVREIKDTDPVQVQFGKHAMLALQETEELIQNLGKLATGIAEYMQQETPGTEEKAAAKGPTQQLGQIILDATATDAVDRALQALQAPGTDGPEAPTNLIKESGKLALEITSAAIDKIPGLRKIINLTKPLHQTIVLGILAPLSTPVALYQMYVTNRWYVETATSVKKAYPAITDFIRDQRDGILRPWQKLSGHCEAMYKIAQQAKLPAEAISQLEVMRKNLAELQTKILLNPSQSQELLNTQLASFSQALSNLTTTYFTTDPTLALSDKNQEEKTPAPSSKIPQEKKSHDLVAQVMHGPLEIHALFQQFVRETKKADKKLDTEQKELIEKTRASLATSAMDTDGYYPDLSSDQETSVSKNLKAIFNVYRGIELLSQNYVGTDPAAQMKAMAHGKKALDHLLKIDWEQINESLDAHYQQLFDAILRHGMATVSAPLEKIAAASHEIELTHHLRFGALLEEVRPLFDGLEGIFHERGLSGASNPLGYNKHQEDILKNKLAKASASGQEVKQQHATITSVLDRLEWYGDYVNDITKPDSAWRKLGYKQNKISTPSSPEKLEETAATLLQELAQIKADGLFKNLSDLYAVKQLEDRLISDLSLEKKRELKKSSKEKKGEAFEELQKKLIHSIAAQVKQNAVNKKKSYYSQATTMIRELRKESEEHRKNKRAKTWPPKELMQVLKRVAHAKKELDGQLLDVTKYEEALQQQQKIRTEYTVHTLKKEGIIALTEAVKEGKDNPQKNIPQKRKLAILLADLGQGTREENLAKAHTITTAFIEDPTAIQKFITAAHAIDPDLGHALTVAATLAGYIDKPVKELFESKEPYLIQQDISNMLDRFAPKQVFEILKGMADNNPSAALKQRAALLVELLYNHSPEISLDEYDINKNLDYINHLDSPHGFTKDALIKLLVKSYRRAESHDPPKNESMQKIGLFLGRLANADPQLAKDIFLYADHYKDHAKLNLAKKLSLYKGKDYNKAQTEVYKQAHAIIKKACLTQSIAARALYYESLISALTLRSGSDIESYAAFLTANRSAVLALHKAINEDTMNDDQIINHYRKDAWALCQLTEKFIATNVLPGSKVEKQLSDFYNTLLRCRDKDLHIEPGKTVTTITQTLQEARKQLEHGIKHLFSDHAIENLIWQEEKKSPQVRPVIDTDPLSIQVSKHCLLALQKAEETGKKVAKFLTALQTSKKKFKTTATHAPEIAKALLELSEHLIAIERLVKEPEAPTATLEKLAALRQTMLDLPKKILSSPDNAQTLLSSQFQQMSQAFTDLARPYASLNRPAAPSEPERKYTASLIKLFLAGEMPKPDHLDGYPPDSYILIKEVSQPWQLIYLNINKTPYTVNLNKMPNLAKILAEKTSTRDAEKDQHVITQHLAQRWNPTAQARAEWFPLIEPLRSAMQGSQKLHEFFAQFIEEAKKKGITLDPEQEKLIVETLAALQDAKQDQQGYYLYNDKETPFSQSLKGLFNLAWGINELSRGFWEHSGTLSSITAITQAGQHGSTLLNHLWKIKWPALGGQFGVLSDQLMNAMLIYGKDKIFPPFEELAKATHETELQHHLRFGVLTEPVRPLLDGLESIFHTRTLGIAANPFGYDPAVAKELQEKLKIAQEKENKEDVAKYTGAIEQQHKMRQEFAIRCLQGEGIIALIEAARHGKDNEPQNIQQKRRLAILLADINLTSREDALADAHAIATAFATNPAKIKDFIQAIAKIDPLMGHTLAIEATLAGYTHGHVFKSNEAILHNEDKHVAQQNLNNAFDRLEAKQVFAMLEAKNKTPTGIFITLLNGNTLTEDHILAATPSEGTTKKDLLAYIVSRYQTLEKTPKSKATEAKKSTDAAWALTQPERELMNKLGLFLGRLTHADAEMARIVFADKNAHSLLKAECLTAETGIKIKAEHALYYESLVNSFNYNYAENKHEQENRTAHDFIAANSPLLVEIYKTLFPDNASNEAIIDKYQQNPILLLEWTEGFIKEKTSASSAAEKRLSEFISAFALCTDNQKIRHTMLVQQQKTHGSRSAQFLELLTPEASIHFWREARKDLVKRPQAILDQDFASKLKDIAEKTQDLSEEKQKQIKDKATEFIATQQKELTHIADNLKNSISKQIAEKLPGGGLVIKAKHWLTTKNDAHIASCRDAVQKMQAVEQAVAKEYALWITEIESLTRVRTLSIEQAELQSLDKKLEAIGEILTEYLQIRSSESASALSYIRHNLRSDKRALAETYQAQFIDLRKAVNTAYIDIEAGRVPVEGYTTLAKRSIKIFEKFQETHKNLIKPKKEKEQPEQDEKMLSTYGKMGKAILKIGSKISPDLSAHQDPADQKISLIAKIIKEIRTALAKYTHSLLSSDTVRNPPEPTHRVIPFATKEKSNTQLNQSSRRFSLSPQPTLSQDSSIGDPAHSKYQKSGSK